MGIGQNAFGFSQSGLKCLNRGMTCTCHASFPSLGRGAHRGSPGSASQSTAGVEMTAQGAGGCAWLCTNKPLKL